MKAMRNKLKARSREGETSPTPTVREIQADETTDCNNSGPTQRRADTVERPSEIAEEVNLHTAVGDDGLSRDDKVKVVEVRGGGGDADLDGEPDLALDLDIPEVPGVLEEEDEEDATPPQLTTVQVQRLFGAMLRMRNEWDMVMLLDSVIHWTQNYTTYCMAKADQRHHSNPPHPTSVT